MIEVYVPPPLGSRDHAATQEAASATTDKDKLTGLSEAQLAWISHSPVCDKDRVPHICPVLTDVGFHKPQPLTVQGVDGHGQDLLLVESDRWTAVESHICQNPADMGHPSLVTHRDLTTWERFVYLFTQGSVRNAG